MARDPHPFHVPSSFIEADGEEGATIRFPADEAHHILHVIRLRAGDECRVTDGQGGLFRVRLEIEGDGGKSDDALRGRILESRRAPSRGAIVEVGFPVLRLHARNDWLIEKAVEAGADVLVPIPWERSLKEASASALKRWERIAREAMKQSERVWLPEFAVDRAPFVRPAGTRWILADPEGEEDLPDLSGAGHVRLLIGPEGGLAEKERERILSQGAALWGLGPDRLRAETAAVIGCHGIARAVRSVRRHSKEGA